MSFLLGYAILKRRVKGAYFAILTQALAVAFATLLIATVTVVIVAYAVWVARATRRRDREIAAATRAELVALSPQ